MEQPLPGMNHLSAKEILKSAGYYGGRAHGSSESRWFKTSSWIEVILGLSEMR